MTEGGLILVVDDEVQIRRFLKISLESGGYKVVETETGKDGITQAATISPDVIILDLGLPDMEGLEFVQKVREWSKIPIIVLTVKDSDSDKVLLLDNGADDYLTKPFSINELKARIRVAYRHKYRKEEPYIFESGKLAIDFSTRIVKKNGEKIKLTPKEYAVLSLLARNAGKVLTQNYILRELWGPYFQEESQYLRIYIMQIRRKIEEEPGNPKIIITEPGVGYRLIDESGSGG
ncbi:MAG TPA: response regulator [Spirochaetota bacterium]|nr:response regulator [Spirochaetota bacterium]